MFGFLLYFFQLAQSQGLTLQQIIESALGGLQFVVKLLAHDLGQLLGVFQVFLRKMRACTLVDNLQHSQQGLFELDRHCEHGARAQSRELVKTLIEF